MNKNKYISGKKNEKKTPQMTQDTTGAAEVEG